MMKRSRSVFEPSTPPMHADFEDAGMAGAMSRLLARFRMLQDSLALPAWLWSLDFGHAVTACSACADVPALIDAMAEATRMLSGGDGVSEAADQSAHPSAPTATQMAAQARLHFGEMMEALAASTASALVRVEEVPSLGMCPTSYSSLAMLYYDSYCAAVWTSAHAEYLATIEDLLYGRAATEALVRDLMVPPPELYTVANVSNLAHLGPLSERLASPKCCTKSSQSLLAILARVTNAGSRGWETTLLAAAKESEGAVRVCMQCVAVALSGMHPVRAPGGSALVARALRGAARAARADAKRLQGARAQGADRHQGGDPLAPRGGVRSRLRDARRDASHTPAHGPARASRRSRCRTRRSPRRCTAWQTRARPCSRARVGRRLDPAAPGERTALAQEERFPLHARATPNTSRSR